MSGQPAPLSQRPGVRPAVRHPIFARLYALVGPLMDRGGLADRRRELLAGLAGRVIEVGAGSGLNFTHYPPAVTGVLAVEPEPRLRRIAERAAGQVSVPLEVVDAVAERLPAGDGAFDAAVASLVLCTVSDPQRATRELHRVIRPGGELRFLEHVRADGGALRRVQRLLDAAGWPAFSGGCHTSRDTVALITEAGFTLDRISRFRFPEGGVTMPTSPHVLGAASRPAP